MNIRELKALLNDFSDELEISWADPNFGGELSQDQADAPAAENFSYVPGRILINFPAVSPIE